MNIKHTIKTGLRSIADHKSRSLLTILGIVIGVAAVIIVMSLGNGAQSLILNQISGLGPETVVLRPGTGLSDVTSVLFSQSLTQKDIDALKKKSNVPNLIEVAPFVILASAIEFEGEKFNPTVIGASVEFFGRVFDLSPEEGLFFSEADIEQGKRVAVIGTELKDELFENMNAIGEDVQIKGRKFEIVGVFPSKENVGGFDFNEMVMIPHTSAQNLTGQNHYPEIMLRADSVSNVNKMVLDIVGTLRDTHDIEYGEEDDFNVQTQKDLIDTIQSVITILTAFLVAAVAISLVVGGVGIMNIMLVSVTERTKEIGLRKALGAKSSDILKQFLFEAIILTSLGGIIGILVGAGVSFITSLILAYTVDPDWVFSFSIGSAVLGVGMSATIGLIFGTYPAIQASKKSPMEALRYE